MITLEPIIYENFYDCISLQTHEHQKKYIASNLFSLAEAYVALTSGAFIPMPYAIYNDDEMVGFILLAYDPAGEDEDDETVYKICRLMIAKEHQGKGYGRQAMERSLEIIRTFPHGKADLVVLSYKSDNEAARSLYSSLGFKETGEFDGDEV